MKGKNFCFESSSETPAETRPEELGFGIASVLSRADK